VNNRLVPHSSSFHRLGATGVSGVLWPRHGQDAHRTRRFKPNETPGFVSKRVPGLGVPGVERQRTPRNTASCGVAALDHSHPQQALRQSLVRAGGRRSNPAGRRGAALVVALVFLAVALMIFTSVLKVTVAQRGALQSHSWGVQAAWLAESALERAAARLAADASYSGGTWKLPAEAIGGQHDAIVTIEVLAVPNEPDRRLVRVRADYPDHPQHRSRQSKQVVVQI